MKLLCSVCNRSFVRSLLKRLRDCWFCKSCYVANRRSNRKALRFELFGRGPRKPKVFTNVKDLLVSDLAPGSVVVLDERETVSRPFLRLSLTSSERQFLFGKYVRKGLDYDEARRLVNQDVDFLCSLKKRLLSDFNAKRIGESDVNLKFKEEFAKLLEVK